MKNLFTLLAAGAFLAAPSAQAAFVVAMDLDPDGTQVLNPNFGFGGDTTAASSSAPSVAVGMPAHDSLFGGNGASSPDSYVISYTPGTDIDNFAPAPGSILGSVTGFGTELASGIAGGGSGAYNVYITAPASTNISGGLSTFTLTGDGAPVTAMLDLNDGGTGANLNPDFPTTAYVGGANNAWYKVGTVDLTAGTTYTLTMEAGSNTFVSMRLAGVMWEPVPEPGSLSLLALGGLAVLRRRR